MASDGDAGAVSFMQALAWLRHSAAGLPVRLVLSSGLHYVDGTLLLDHLTPASEIWIEGVDSNATLAPLSPSQPLLVLEHGAPPTHLRGLRILGRVRVHGSTLEIVGCDVAGGHSQSTDRALAIHGGDVTVRSTSLSHHPAGAILVTNGELLLVASRLRHNQAEYGAGMWVTGGTVIADATAFERNSARLHGGGLLADGGNIWLHNHTAFRFNSALSGSSLERRFPSSRDNVYSLTYELPAEPGHWVIAPFETYSFLQPGPIDADFPYPCSAGKCKSHATKAASMLLYATRADSPQVTSWRPLCVTLRPRRCQRRERSKSSERPSLQGELPSRCS